MRPRFLGDRRRRTRPGAEFLEPRGLLSAVAASLAHRAAEVAPPSGTPTPHEVVRESFSAAFSGRYTTGPGRFSSEALRTFLVVAGTSNQFLHGNALVSLTTPADPAAPATGVAALYPKNTQSTGNVLLLDLVGTPQADPSKPPTHFTWTINNNAGGLYYNAVGSGIARHQLCQPVPRRAPARSSTPAGSAWSSGVRSTRRGSGTSSGSAADRPIRRSGVPGGAGRYRRRSAAKARRMSAS